MYDCLLICICVFHNYPTYSSSILQPAVCNLGPFTEPIRYSLTIPLAVYRRPSVTTGPRFLFLQKTYYPQGWSCYYGGEHTEIASNPIPKQLIAPLMRHNMIHQCRPHSSPLFQTLNTNRIPYQKPFWLSSPCCIISSAIRCRSFLVRLIPKIIMLITKTMPCMSGNV